MKAAMLLTGSGPIIVLTSYGSLDDETFLKTLEAKGIHKFIAYELPPALLRQRYGAHFFVVEDKLDEKQDLRFLDTNGQRVFEKIRFAELGTPRFFEGGELRGA
jgi:response regulator RpfG family c-di-GMP phosphodiesterase